MMAPAHPFANRSVPGDYLVPGPRSTDAIGAALRDAYDREGPAPEAMLAALAALDRRGRA